MRAGLCYSTDRYSSSTVPCNSGHPLQTLKPSPLLVPSTFAVTRSRKERGRGREEKRREGKLGYVFVDPRRSSPKTGRDSFPLLVFPQFGSLPRCSWWFPMCAAAWGQLKGYRDPRRQENGGESLFGSSPLPSSLIFSRGNPR